MALSKAKQLVQTLALISLLLLMLAVSKVQSTNFNQLPEGYVVFSYNSFNPKPEDLIYEGDAHVVPGSTFLRLTYPDKASRGQVLYSKPVTTRKRGTSKKATFFTIIIVNITPPPSNLPPEDISLLIQPFDGVVGGKLGIFDSSSSSSSSVTNSNSSSSIITVVKGDDPDPNHRYVRININPAAARRKSTNDHGDNDGMLLAGQQVRLEISYLAETTTLSFLATSGSERYEESVVFDLMSILPQHVQVGVLASTAVDKAAIYDLDWWFFLSWLPFDQKKSQNGKETYIKQYV